MNKQKTARQIYRFLNEEFFDGVLPEPLNFVFGKFGKDDFIAAASTNGNLYFTTHPDYTYDHIEIMLHEMCHVYQMITNSVNWKNCHGKTFKEIALDISQRSGYDIREMQEYYEVLTNV